MYTDYYIDKEMDGAILWNQPAEELIKSVFPDSKLPVNVGALLSFYKSKLEPDSLHYSTQHKRWIFMPLMTSTTDEPGIKEENFASFMTQLGNSALHFPFFRWLFIAQRAFTGAFSTKPVQHTGSPLQRKPDVLGANHYLLQRIIENLQSGDGITWPNVHVVIEIKSKPSEKTFKDDVHKDVANKVMAILDQQPYRRFVPTLQILGYKAYFSLWNRAGVVHS